MIFIERQPKFNPTTTAAFLRPSEMSIAMTIHLFRSVAFFALAFIAFAPAICLAGSAEPAVTLNDELLTLDTELRQAKDRLSETVMQMREAKQNATEKRIDLEKQQALFVQEPNPFHEGRVHHAKQRLALAEMRIDSVAARFEHIQRRMEDLAAARLQLLASHENQTLATTNSGLSSSTEPKHKSAKTPPKPATTKPVRRQAAAAKPDHRAPVLSLQGKLTDPLTVEDELQKLERHLITQDAQPKIAQHVKAFGSTIAGEVALAELGANQYFARFIATQPRTQLVVGARFGEYVRTAADLVFTEEEIGQEFILIFDANHIEDLRMIVFPSTLLTDKKAFAAY